jgi:HemY protein
LPSDKSAAIDTAEFNEPISEPRRVEPPRDPPMDVKPPAQDNLPGATAAKLGALEPPEAPTAAPSSAPTETETPTAAPLFRQRHEMPKSGSSSIPPVIPIVRPPDDPGIEDEPVADEFAEQISPSQGQAGGWRGFLSRWGG